jgi:hypothetical protein
LRAIAHALTEITRKSGAKYFPIGLAAKGAITIDECRSIEHYRVDRSLTSSQSELIDSLIRQQALGLQQKVGA